jgi:dihydroorotate dehydrogenase electron transfer subunit
MRDRICTVKEIEKTGNDMYSLWLQTKHFGTLPGNFAMLEIPGHTLRRPLAIASMEKDYLRFVFKIAGNGTKELAKLQKGTNIRVLAPLGNSFPVTESKKRPVLVGGGTGSVSIFALAKFFKKLKKKPVIIIGAKSKKYLPLKDEFSRFGELLISTDDGSCGKQCNTAQLFSEVAESNPDIIVYTCGPHAMMEAIHTIASKRALESYSSVEERMACGVGACVGCVVKTKDGLKRVCKDGPVFNSYDLFGQG